MNLTTQDRARLGAWGRAIVVIATIALATIYAELTATDLEVPAVFLGLVAGACMATLLEVVG